MPLGIEEAFAVVSTRRSGFTGEGLGFALERINAPAPQHPEWKTKQSLKAVLPDDLPSSGDRDVSGAHIREGYNVAQI